MSCSPFQGFASAKLHKFDDFSKQFPEWFAAQPTDQTDTRDYKPPERLQFDFLAKGEVSLHLDPNFALSVNYRIV